EAAALLPGVDELVVYPAEWVDPEPRPVERAAVMDLVDRLAGLDAGAGGILTSFHQSPPPLALLLRVAGVRRLGAISPDYPGSLLDVRHQAPDDVHEVERSLSLAAAMGFPLPPGDEGALRVRRATRLPAEVARLGPFVAVHPGAAAPAR